MPVLGLPVPTQLQAQQSQRPNIVIIWGDDIAQSNISAYSHGVMGYKTVSPNTSV
jgi:arylsulfatase A-like enzyme